MQSGSYLSCAACTLPRPILTSPIAIAEVREAPYIAKPNSVANARENKLDLVAPVATLEVLVSLSRLTRHSTILPEEDSQLLQVGEWQEGGRR